MRPGSSQPFSTNFAMINLNLAMQIRLAAGFGLQCFSYFVALHAACSYKCILQVIPV